jgi:hypothetical protein
MILMPEKTFLERLVHHRDARLRKLGASRSPEALNILVAQVNRELISEFNVSEASVRHRLRGLLYLKGGDFLSLTS